MGEQDGTILDDMGTVSENNPGDVPPAEETPPENEGGTGDPADQPTEPVEPEDPAEGNEQQPGDDTPDPGKEEQETPPSAGAADMQEILDGFREEIGTDNSSVDALTDSVLALVERMDAQEAQARAVTIPYRGWKYWKYPVSVDYGTMEMGAGSWDDVTETCSTPQDFEDLYTWLDEMFNDGVTADWNIWKIYNDSTAFFEFGKPGTTPAETPLPFEGNEGWAYPVTVDYTISPWGAAETGCTQTFDSADALKKEYSDLVNACQDGGGLKDFSVQRITDINGVPVYEHQMEPDPGEEGQKETVELLLSHLEGINTTLSGMEQADAEYYQMVKDYQSEMLEMQAANTATNIFICIGVFAVFGALVFWQFLGRFK